MAAAAGICGIVWSLLAEGTFLLGQKVDAT